MIDALILFFVLCVGFMGGVLYARDVYAPRITRGKGKRKCTR